MTLKAAKPALSGRGVRVGFGLACSSDPEATTTQPLVEKNLSGEGEGVTPQNGGGLA